MLAARRAVWVAPLARRLLRTSACVRWEEPRPKVHVTTPVGTESVFSVPRKASGAVDWTALVHRVQSMAPWLGGVVVGTVAVYGLSKMLVSMASTLLNLTLTDALYVGFGAGMVGASGIIALSMLGLRRFRIRPEPVFQSALSRVRAHSSVSAALGSPVQASELRAYTIRPGHLTRATGLGLAWVHPRVQMLFAIQGPHGKGMVTCEALRKGAELDFTLIAVDVLFQSTNHQHHPHPPKQQQQQQQSHHRPIIVAGTAERLEVAGQLREFLQAERVTPIRPTHAEPDR